MNRIELADGDEIAVTDSHALLQLAGPPTVESRQDGSSLTFNPIPLQEVATGDQFASGTVPAGA